MKKFTIATLLALATLTASATEITVSGVRDTTRDNVTGSSIAVAQKIGKDLTVTAQIENTAGKTGTNTNQYVLTSTYDATTVGPFTLSGIGGLGFIDTQVDSRAGTYLIFGASAATKVPFLANTTASIGLVRQLGTSAVNTLDHTKGVIGLRYQATKVVIIGGNAEFYNDTPGSKMSLGVSYAF